MPEYSCAEGSYNKSDWSNLGNHSALNATETADVCDLSCNIEFDNSTMQNTIGTVRDNSAEGTVRKGTFYLDKSFVPN